MGIFGKNPCFCTYVKIGKVGFLLKMAQITASKAHFERFPLISTVKGVVEKIF